MKSTFVAVLVAALVAVAGCGKGTSGGPGTGKARVGQADDTFTLSVPTLSTKLKQTESKVVTIGIKRGKNFAQDVALKFEGQPAGVTIEPAAAAIKKGADETKVTVKATAEAAVGDHTIKVTGHPETGTDAANEFKITVQAK